MDELRKRRQITALIAGAMIASVFIYALVAMVIQESGPLPGFSGSKEQEQMLRIFIFAIAIGDALFTFIFKKFLLAGSAGIAQGMNESLVIPVLAQKLQVTTIVVLAFCESVAVFGLVLFFLTGNNSDMYILLALSLLLFIFHFPRLGKWRDFISDRQTASIINQGKI